MKPRGAEVGRPGWFHLASLLLHLGLCFAVMERPGGVDREQLPSAVLVYLESHPAPAPVLPARTRRETAAAAPLSGGGAPPVRPPEKSLPAALRLSHPQEARLKRQEPVTTAAPLRPEAKAPGKGAPSPAAAEPLSPLKGEIRAAPPRGRSQAAADSGSGGAGEEPATGAVERGASPALPGKGEGGRAANGTSRRGSYQSLLKSLIEAHKRYPAAARRSGQQGSCVRRFSLERGGALRSVETVTSCGHPFLDGAATRAITAVGSFPPLPEEFAGAEESFSVTITFTLAAN